MPPTFTIGIEEEYQTVDPVSRDLRSHIHAEIIEKGKLILQERVKSELHQSVVEVGTSVCSSIKEAKEEVKKLRRDIGKVFDKFPRTNIPDYFPSWGEYESFIKLLIKTNCIDNAKKIWWDIRPHPFFNTLEFRVCDIPMRVDETIALAALIQATVAKLYKLYSANQGFRLYRRALIMENKWRAARYGLDGKLIDFGKQKEVPVRDLIHEYLDFIDDVVDELDSREELNYLRQILETGSGADRQLRVFQETGDLKKVVEYMIAETEAGLTESVASARKVG